MNGRKLYFLHYVHVLKQLNKFCNIQTLLVTLQSFIMSCLKFVLRLVICNSKVLVSISATSTRWLSCSSESSHCCPLFTASLPSTDYCTLWLSFSRLSAFSRHWAILKNMSKQKWIEGAYWMKQKILLCLFCYFVIF